MKTRRPDPSLDDIDTAASAWIIRRDAGLTAAEEGAFEHWRSSDPRHAAAFARHEQAWSLLDRPRQSGEGEFMRREYTIRKVWRRHKRIGAAAVLFSVILAFCLNIWRGPESAALEPAVVATASVVVAKRKVLTDGSRIDLKSGAEITVAFAPKIRRVSLRKGEAHFQVAKDSSRPFIVRAAGIEVFAVGTAFSVEMGDREIAVLVTEGRVAINRLADNSTPRAEPMLVDAGYRMVAPVDSSSSAASLIAAMSPPEIDEQLGWRKAHLEFTNTPLREAVMLLNQYAAPHGPTRLAIEDPVVAAVLVTGYFRAESLEAFVRLIGASAGIEAERVGNIIILRKPR